MLDYGKSVQFMVAQGLAWDAPGPASRRPVVVPATWDLDAPRAWDAVMAARGFVTCDERRWIWTRAPGRVAFGVTAIVGQPLEEDASPLLDVTVSVDTEATENDGAWWYPAARFATPLEAATWALAYLAPFVAWSEPPPASVLAGPFWDENAGNEWVMRAIDLDGSCPVDEHGFPYCYGGHSPEQARAAYLRAMAARYGQTPLAQAVDGMGRALAQLSRG